ncbi:MAG TPA: RluA family pseudouridine synthase [Chitinophagaceae bacterium]|nr:RluA family pseudouridine synthase [Chitinophagaceae bacterium]
MKLDILYEDEHYVFVNKPSGVLTIPDRHNAELPNIKSALLRLYPTIFVVHRLDRDTSGCLCFAKDEQTHAYMSALFEKREVDKYYLGIVHGCPIETHQLIEAAIMEHPVVKGRMIVHAKQGKYSATEYEVVENFGRYALLQFKLLTGRTHQIRVHMQHIEHPLVCDATYGSPDPVFISSLKKNFKLSKWTEEEKPILHRLALHAFKLSFKTEAGQLLTIEAPLPKDMNAMLNQCRKWLK